MKNKMIYGFESRKNIEVSRNVYRLKGIEEKCVYRQDVLDEKEIQTEEYFLRRRMLTVGFHGGETK